MKSSTSLFRWKKRLGIRQVFRKSYCTYHCRYAHKGTKKGATALWSRNPMNLTHGKLRQRQPKNEMSTITMQTFKLGYQTPCRSYHESFTACSHHRYRSAGRHLSAQQLCTISINSQICWILILLPQWDQGSETSTQRTLLELQDLKVHSCALHCTTKSSNEDISKEWIVQ